MPPKNRIRKEKYDNRPIGIFDSGIGGLSLVSEVKAQLPKENVIYFADVARQPFGEKSVEEVLAASEEISGFLMEKDVKALVVACSTASAVAFSSIKEKFDVPVVGIFTDWLVRDVVSSTKKKKVGIISTELTAKSGSLSLAIKNASPEIEIVSVPCSPLVNLISDGDVFGYKIVKAATEYVTPLIRQGCDTLVLGCTHFNFIREVISYVVDYRMEIIAPPYSSIATLRSVLDDKGALSSPNSDPQYLYYATGDVMSFNELVGKLWDDANGSSFAPSYRDEERSKLIAAGDEHYSIK